MKSSTVLFCLVFLSFGPKCVLGEREKRGFKHLTGSLLAKLRIAPAETNLNHNYDPREHFYAMFLNSSYVTISYTEGSTQPTAVRGMGLFDLFKQPTTEDPQEKRYMMFLRALDKNMTSSKNKGLKSITAEIVEFETTEKMIPSDEPAYDVEENVLKTVEDGPQKEDNPEEEIGAVTESTEDENLEEENEHKDNIWEPHRVIPKRFRKAHTSKLKGQAPLKEKEPKEENLDDIKFLFPDQLGR